MRLSHRPVAVLRLLPPRGGRSALTALMLALLAAVPVRPAEPDWQKELGDWRTQRYERLVAPDGWLSLVGRFWLQEGSNRLGSSPANEMVLAVGPPLLGTFELKGKEVTFVAAPGAGVRAAGAAVTRIAMVTDSSPKPTVLEAGTLSCYIIERSGRLAVRVKDREATSRREFAGLDYFPAGPEWRVRARLEAAAPGTTIQVPNVLGAVEATPTAGDLVFELGGATRRLSTILEPDSDELFIVFGDATNGRETYGGGRFLYAARPGPDGTTTLDFNRAYNPPCAFTPWATCPLPTRDNRLPFRIEAGEKKYAKGHS